MPTDPEPSRVHGYITLVDPNTHQKYIPRDEMGNVGGVPLNLYLVFQATSGGTVRVNLLGGGSTQWLGGRGDAAGNLIAFIYEFRLNQVPGYQGAPSLYWGPGKFATVTYDPDRYHYVTVEADIFSFRGSNSSEIIVVPLHARPTPFPDLPPL